MARTKVTSGPKTHTLPSSAATPDAGDRIFLHGLAVECIIGFIEWERRVKQTIVLDVEMPVDCARAARSDDVADTLDYKKVAKRLIAFVERLGFQAGRDAGASRRAADPRGIRRRVGAAVGEQARRDPRHARTWAWRCCARAPTSPR